MLLVLNTGNPEQLYKYNRSKFLHLFKKEMISTRFVDSA